MPIEGQSASEDIGGESAMAVATAADPTYVEGRLHRLSQTLTGALRVALDPSATAGVVLTKQAALVSAGASQWALAITTNTTLTVPAGSTIAQISVETANVRYTDDGTSATTTNGQIAYAGQQFQYAGPMSALKFTAVSGSPTINVSYYK